VVVTRDQVRFAKLGVGLLSDGFGRDELKRNGALRVYEGSADLEA